MTGWYLRPSTVREPSGTQTSTVGRRYQATAIEDFECFMCAVVTVMFGDCNLMRFVVICSYKCVKSCYKSKPCL
jgi:hypothetical protein